jgi:hypothetical protein
MTLDEYVLSLEKDVDIKLVECIKDWPNDTKLYMYLHNIQLDKMMKFEKLLLEMNTAQVHN